MKKHEITKLAQDEIAKAIADGFTINLFEATGSYSDVEGTQVVLARGDERIIMWCEEVYGYRRKDGCNIDSIRLFISRIDLHGDSMERVAYWPSDWKEHAFFEREVYKVGYDWYSEDLAEAERAEDMRLERYRSKPNRWRSDYDLPITDELLGIARRLKGFKRIRRDDLLVRKSWHSNRWTFRNRNTGTEAVVSC